MSKKPSAGAKAAASPAASGQGKSLNGCSKKNAENLPACTGCGILITKDTRALMCDKCQSPEAWKCLTCLNLSTEVYDMLVDVNCTSLIHLCDDCESSAMHPSPVSGEESSKTLDTLQEMSKSLTYLVTNDNSEDLKLMLQKMFEKFECMEQTMRDKADAKAMTQLEKRLQSLEDQMIQNTMIVLVQKLEREEAQCGSLNKRVEDVVTMLSERHDEWRSNVANSAVVETIQSKLQEDETEKEEQQKRKNSVIVFGLNESSSDEATVRVVEDVENMESV